MKLLTLNLHGWLEVHQIPKIYELAQFIAQQQVDLVALQEVNQFIHSPIVSQPAGYLGGDGHPVRQDNLVLVLNHFLAELTGAPFHWGWAVSHLGFDRYDEGVALLSRKPLARVEALDLSPSYSYRDVERRVAIAAQLEEGPWFASTHMSWWQLENKPLFEGEFRLLNQKLRQLADGQPILLAGDFNNAAQVEGEGYDLATSLGWLDTRNLAEQVEGEATVHKAIHGWDQVTQALRIDLVLADQPLAVASHRVIFPDDQPTALSDHSGLLLEFEL